MQSGLSAEAMLTAWEAGARRAALDRALALLWAGGAGDGAADLGLPERDRRLLALHRATFGPEIASLATCPECGAEVEVTLDARLLEAALEVPPESALALSGGEIVLRQLTSRDLAAAQDVPPEAAPAFLRARVVPGNDTFSDEDAARIDAGIEAQAAAAELLCRLECPECGADWREALDIAEHLWAEVEMAALLTLSDVAQLARAFGWTEADVLALTPARRAVYLRHAREIG